MPTADETPAASTLVGSKVICDELGINRSTLSRWVDAGRIRPASRVGGFVFWREDYDKLKAEMMNLPQATQGESAEPQDGGPPETPAATPGSISSGGPPP